MANVGFKLGLQSAADNIIAGKGGTAVVGSFYLTSDTNRLYIGAEDKTDSSKTTLYPVNEGIIAVSSLDDLASSINTQLDAAYIGRFYYVNGENILAIYAGKGKFIQINADTDNTIKTFEVFGEAADNVASVSYRITDKGDNQHTATLQIKTENGLTCDYDVDNDVITITGDTYSISSSKQAANKYAITLESENVSDNSSSVTLIGTDDVKISNTNDNEIEISVKSPRNKTMSVSTETTDTATGFKVSVEDTEGGIVDTVIDPVIKYGGDLTHPFVATFVEGAAELNMYSKSEIDKKMQEMNAMHYLGTVGEKGSAITSIVYTTANGYDVKKSGSTVSLSIGDTVMVTTEDNRDRWDFFDKVSNSTLKLTKGALLIARSSDGTEEASGFIDPKKLEFDVVESTNDSDTRFMLSRLIDTTKHGLALTTTKGDEVGSFNVQTGALGNITLDGETKQAVGANVSVTSEYTTTTDGTNATIKVSHDLVGLTTTTETKEQNNSSTLTFDAIKEIDVDHTGHVTKVVTESVTVKDTSLSANDSIITTTSDAYTSTTGANVGVVKNNIVAIDTGGNEVMDTSDYFTLVSDSLTITTNKTKGYDAAHESSGEEGLSIDMVWGSF